MSVRVFIERLVLEGLPVEHGQAALVQAAVEAELASLFGQEALPGSLTSVASPAVSAPAITIHRNAGPTQLGQQIARAVHGGLVP